MSEKLLVEDFADSVLIIDDCREEVDGLIDQLKLNDILFDFYTPKELVDKKLCKIRQLVFLDFKLDASRPEPAENLSIVRGILQRLFPVTNKEEYGIVLWTSHVEYLDFVRDKISIDRRNKAYNTPLFIVGLDKKLYLTKGFDKCLSDLNDVIKHDKAAFFFLNWSVSVRKAAGLALSDIYSLVSNYASQDLELQYILYLLARNHTGVPKEKLDETQNYSLSTDACKAFDELLYADLINKLNIGEMELFDSATIDNPWADDYQNALGIYAKLNTKAFIDTTNIDQAIIVPGNVYEINGSEIPKECSFPKKSRKIMIELTPPCDFSHKKIFSRCVCGFMIECSSNVAKQKYRDKYFKGDYRYLLWPISFDGKVWMICFDFRCLLSLQDAEISSADRCTILFKANPRLFADILQKFSSHAARLGVPTIIPDMP